MFFFLSLSAVVVLRLLLLLLRRLLLVLEMKLTRSFGMYVLWPLLPPPCVLLFLWLDWIGLVWFVVTFFLFCFSFRLYINYSERVCVRIFINKILAMVLFLVV